MYPSFLLYRILYPIGLYNAHIENINVNSK